MAKDNETVTLINPPWQFGSPAKLYPLGVTYLAARLLKGGLDDVHIVDLNFEICEPENVFGQSLALVEKTGPGIIGLTCWTVQLPFCIEFVQAYKKKYPDVKVILGGVHASSQPDELMKLCPVDVIARGEGEETITELVAALRENRDLGNVAGISFRKNGVVQRNEDRPLIRDLDEVPFPAYHLLPGIELYQPLNRRQVFSLMASRGCSYKCIFCSTSRLWKHQRWRSPGNVLEEVAWLKKTYDVGFVRFEDDDLTAKRDWAVKVFSGLQELNIPFGCLARLDKVDPELLLIMKDAGCQEIYHGLESASERLWKVVRKGFPSWLTLDRIRDLVAYEVGIGLTPTVSAMIGIPSETQREVRETFEFMRGLRALGAKTQLWIMTPYPDTEAVILYAQNLMRIDRWKELKQFDIFSSVPREAYGHLLKKYAELIPDNWIFLDKNVRFQELKELYLEGASRILGELEFV